MAVLTLVLAAAGAGPAHARDSLAPPGAAAHWLPNEQWVNLLWLPYDEARLYEVLGATRGEVFRWVRNDSSHTLAQLARRRGLTVRAAAARLVDARRGRASRRLNRTLRRAAERTLTQGHLAQHLLFHALHQSAVASRAARIFGVSGQSEFLALRRAELSPLQIGDLHRRTRAQMETGVARALRDAVRQGRRSGFLTSAQGARMLARQLRQIPRWLGQARFIGPAGRPSGTKLPTGGAARHPSIAADGSVVTWDAEPSSGSTVRRRGEVHVMGAALPDLRRAFAVSAGEGSRPASSLGSVLAAGGGSVAYELTGSAFPLATRVGQSSVLVRDLRSGQVDDVSHGARPGGAPVRTAFDPSISADGRIVAFEVSEGRADDGGSRSALIVTDRRTREEQRIAERGAPAAAYGPRLSADGSTVAYVDADPAKPSRTQVFVRPARGGGAVLVSRASGVAGAVAGADASEPAISQDGAVVAFTTRAANLGAGGRSSKAFVRDLRTGTTEVVADAGGDVLQPALSADGRFVAYVLRRRAAGRALVRLRSAVMLWDRAARRVTIVTVARSGRPADGYASEPAVSADGTRVVFTSTAGGLSRAKPRGLSGVFLRDLRSGTTTLLSSRASAARAGAAQAGGAAHASAASRGPLMLCALG